MKTKVNGSAIRTTILVKANLLDEPLPMSQELEEGLLLCHQLCPMDRAEPKAVIRLLLTYRMIERKG